jgi:putative SOS response-associated peptidase YedK
MPVILIEPEEIETWMTAPAAEALKLKLQRALPDAVLEIVARGEHEDEALLEPTGLALPTRL